jgi:hypothetical protein
MGAEPFNVTYEGTLESAFIQAKEDAFYNYGHAGYTGTIAEKGTFLKIDIPLKYNGKIASPQASELINDIEADSPNVPQWILKAYHDKWGPALAIRVGPSRWCFLGWAAT